MKTPKKPKNHRRAADKTTLTISLPKELREQIEKQAKADNRTTSNFIVTELAKKLGISLALALSFIHLSRTDCGTAKNAWTASSFAATLKLAWAKL
jgi:hypothetical protein